MPTTKKTTTKTAAKDAKTVKTVKAEKKPAEKKCAAKARKCVEAKAVKSAPKGKLTRVIAKFDAGWGNQLYIRGLGGSLDWNKGVPMQSVSEDEWLWEQLVPEGSVEFKVLLNDSQWMDGENLAVSTFFARIGFSPTRVFLSLCY